MTRTRLLFFPSLRLGLGLRGAATRRRGAGLRPVTWPRTSLARARPPARPRPRLLLLLFSPLQLDSAARCAPRGFWGETPTGCGRRVATAAVREGDADKVSANVAAAGTAPTDAPPPSHSARARPRGRGDKAGGAPRSPPPPGPLALATGSFLPRQPRSRARPLLSPIVPRKQNGGVGGEDPVRAHPSPPRGPSSGGSVSRGGCARTGPPAAASPGPGFVCCDVPCVRAHVLDAHTPLRLGASRPARQERPPSSPAPLCPTPAPASRRVPGSGGGKRSRLCLYMARGVGPPFLR